MLTVDIGEVERVANAAKRFDKAAFGGCLVTLQQHSAGSIDIGTSEPNAPRCHELTASTRTIGDSPLNVEMMSPGCSRNGASTTWCSRALRNTPGGVRSTKVDQAETAGQHDHFAVPPRHHRSVDDELTIWLVHSVFGAADDE